MFAWYWIIIAVSLAFPFLYRLVIKCIIVPIKVHRTKTLAMHPNLPAGAKPSS
jgi:hypothetical protein